MKRRGLRILLGLLVLGVWGAVIARALRRSAPPTDTVTTPFPQQVATDSSRTDSDATPIRLARDPFLDGVDAPPVAAPTVPAAPRSVVHGPPPAPTATRSWPKVVYKGTLHAREAPLTTVAFLAVDGHDLLLRPGQPLAGLDVVRMDMDSIVLRWSGEERTFARK